MTVMSEGLPCFATVCPAADIAAQHFLFFSVRENALGLGWRQDGQPVVSCALPVYVLLMA